MDVPSVSGVAKNRRALESGFANFGIHPRRAAEYADRLPEIGRYIETSPAIGEIGLDFHWVKDTSTYPAQRKVLEYFIAAADEQEQVRQPAHQSRRKRNPRLLEKHDVNAR